MLVVLTYDVNITTAFGEKRLRKVAKLCERYGIRVQNSVFEILVDSSQLTALKSQLESIIDHEQDSVRLYRLGNSYQSRIDTIGKARVVETGAPLLL